MGAEEERTIRTLGEIAAAMEVRDERWHLTVSPDEYGAITEHRMSTGGHADVWTYNFRVALAKIIPAFAGAEPAPTVKLTIAGSHA